MVLTTWFCCQALRLRFAKTITVDSTVGRVISRSSGRALTFFVSGACWGRASSHR